jgi:glyoxylase-like metal-dependent hydrolase (beta-lactamase superfamily II)
MTTDKLGPLSWDVFVAPAKPVVTDDLPPDGHKRTWSPTSATLISGERDAVLVDPLMTIDEARDLAAWVGATGKNLTTIYVTHGHGDHFFGIGAVLERFPGARAVAAPAVVEHMRHQAAPDFVAEFWKPRFPGQILEPIALADALTEGTIGLEGHDLMVVELGHTDTDSTTCLYVPSVGLVVAGDAAYNDVHLYMAESTPRGRSEWIAALDTIEALHPRAVVAGHKRPGNDDSPRIIEETRQYIREFGVIADAAVTAKELYERVLDIYPDRVNPGALWSSARALVPVLMPD